MVGRKLGKWRGHHLEIPSYVVHRASPLKVKETDSERWNSLAKVPPHSGFHTQACLTVQPFPLPTDSLPGEAR